MGKLAVAGASVLAGGGVSAGGVMLSRMFSFDSTLPKTLDDFKNGNGGGCVQSLFPGLKDVKGDGITEASSTSKVENLLDSNKQDKVSGCLIVNGDKDEYAVSGDTKWKGNFRFLWAVQQENKGFIVFTTADTTGSSEKKLLWKGIAYSLEKGEGKEGKLAKKRELPKSGSADKKTDKDTTDSKFPKAHTDLTSKSFGGFMKDKEDMEKMCVGSDCAGTSTPSYFQGYGAWRGSSTEKTKKLGDGTSNNISDVSNSGGKELFGENEWNMKEVVENVTGQGDRKVGYGIDD